MRIVVVGTVLAVTLGNWLANALDINSLANPFSLSFGNTPATLIYYGLAGNFVGLYEFFFKVPDGLADGDYQINVTLNGTKVPQTMFLTVHK